MLNFIRRVELGATIVMSVAVILTAWASFQSARWGGIQAQHYQSANHARVESAGLTARATSLTSIDIDVFIAWLGAVMDEVADGTTSIADGYLPVEGTNSAFFFERFRPEMMPAMNAWLESRPLLDPEAPSSPFVMPEYRVAESIRAAELRSEAEAENELALAAGGNSSAHTLVAVLLAMSLFFGGISSKLDHERNQKAFVVIADVIIVGAVIVLIVLPKAPLW